MPPTPELRIPRRGKHSTLSSVNDVISIIRTLTVFCITYAINHCVWHLETAKTVVECPWDQQREPRG